MLSWVAGILNCISCVARRRWAFATGTNHDAGGSRFAQVRSFRKAHPISHRAAGQNPEVGSAIIHVLC